MFLLLFSPLHMGEGKAGGFNEHRTLPPFRGRGEFRKTAFSTVFTTTEVRSAPQYNLVLLISPCSYHLGSKFGEMNENLFLGTSRALGLAFLLRSVPTKQSRHRGVGMPRFSVSGQCRTQIVALMAWCFESHKAFVDAVDVASRGHVAERERDESTSRLLARSCTGRPGWPVGLCGVDMPLASTQRLNPIKSIFTCLRTLNGTGNLPDPRLTNNQRHERALQWVWTHRVTGRRVKPVVPF